MRCGDGSNSLLHMRTPACPSSFGIASMLPCAPVVMLALKPNPWMRSVSAAAAAAAPPAAPASCSPAPEAWRSEAVIQIGYGGREAAQPSPLQRQQLSWQAPTLQQLLHVLLVQLGLLELLGCLWLHAQRLQGVSMGARGTHVPLCMVQQMVQCWAWALTAHEQASCALTMQQAAATAHPRQAAGEPGRARPAAGKTAQGERPPPSSSPAPAASPLPARWPHPPHCVPRRAYTRTRRAPSATCSDAMACFQVKVSVKMIRENATKGRALAAEASRRRNTRLEEA